MSLQSSTGLLRLDLRPLVRRCGATPIFVIHGDRDVVIPPAQSERVFEEIPGPKRRWVGRGSHSNVVTECFGEYQRRVIDFLDEARGGPPGGRVRPWTRS